MRRELDPVPPSGLFTERIRRAASGESWFPWADAGDVRGGHAGPGQPEPPKAPVQLSAGAAARPAGGRRDGWARGGEPAGAEMGAGRARTSSSPSCSRAGAVRPLCPRPPEKPVLGRRRLRLTPCRGPAGRPAGGRCRALGRARPVGARRPARGSRGRGPWWAVVPGPGGGSPLRWWPR